MWSTAMNGSCRAHAMALANENPTRRAPARPGPCVAADPVEIVRVHTGIVEGAVRELADGLDMGPGRHLGHDAPEPGMQRHL